MLVLSRKQDERILIGNDIAVTVVRITGHTVRIGVDAPEGMPVQRQEVYDAIRKQRLQSPVASLQDYFQVPKAKGDDASSTDP